jgi:type I restriction enzyme S subunit
MNTQKKVPALRFPEFNGDWEEKEYGEIFSFKVTNSLSRENLNYESGEVKNIHYGDIHTKFNTLFDITKEYVPFINKEIKVSRITDENYCKEGDLVIADASEDYADVGKCIEITNLNDEKVLAGLHTFLARPNLFEMAIGFNGYLMKSPKVRLQIMTIAQGTKVLVITYLTHLKSKV